MGGRGRSFWVLISSRLANPRRSVPRVQRAELGASSEHGWVFQSWSMYGILQHRSRHAGGGGGYSTFSKQAPSLPVRGAPRYHFDFAQVPTLAGSVGLRANCAEHSMWHDCFAAQLAMEKSGSFTDRNFVGSEYRRSEWRKSMDSAAGLGTVTRPRV